jgi:hypothetical protein
LRRAVQLCRLSTGPGSAGTSSWYLWPQPWYGTDNQYAACATCFVRVLAADVNGDGYDDLVHVRTSDNGLVWRAHLSDGAGGYSPQPWYGTGN